MHSIKKGLPRKIWGKLLILFTLGVFTICLSLLILTSIFNQKMGNIFFGEVPVLYNVRLAQLFFEHSSYPPFGKPASFAHYQLSRTYFIQGNLLEARIEAEKELELYPDNKRTYYILGLTYGYIGQEEKAIKAFEKFLEWKPDSWAARNDRAWLQFRVGDIDGALATLEPVATWRKIPWTQNTYGVLLMNKGRYIEAKEAFLNAKRDADNMTEAQWGIAYPGNDPRMYSAGLAAMRASIEENLKLIDEKLGK